jgi:hypothetical protein
MVTEGYTYAARVKAVCLVQGSFSVCRPVLNPNSPIRTNSMRQG